MNLIILLAGSKIVLQSKSAANQPISPGYLASYHQKSVAMGRDGPSPDPIFCGRGRVREVVSVCRPLNAYVYGKNIRDREKAVAMARWSP